MAKSFTGVVSSDKADKTIVVAVENRKTHPIYKKQYSVTRKFIAHDEQNQAKIGDTVLIEESRPISKRKHFVMKQVIAEAEIRHDEPEPQEQLEEQVEEDKS